MAASRTPSLLSDDLLRHLMAAGQTDVLIGIPTLNNAATLEPVLSALHQAVAEGLAHSRVLVVNSDGGSHDGTQALIGLAARSRTATLLASHSLRTMHRIAAPYHGLPGKRAAIRTLFAAADLLQVGAVAIIDPAASSPSADVYRALLLAVVEGSADFVAPSPLRDPREGPFVTQVVRPLIAGTFGASFADPLAEEFAASGRFAADILRCQMWDAEPLRAGVDIWLKAHALANGFKTTEVTTAPRPRSPAAAQATLRDVVQQVLPAVWTCLDAYAQQWAEGTPAAWPSQTVLSHGAAAILHWDLGEMTAAFRTAANDLEPVWRSILPGPMVDVLTLAAAGSDTSRLGEPLWADVLVEFALAWRARRMRADDLTASFAPIYLGRAAAFLDETRSLDAASARTRVDDLVRHVQQRRERLQEAWRDARAGGAS
jgi:hypothetical protein